MRMNCKSPSSYYILKRQRNWYRHAHANIKICKHSEYGAEVGNAYIRLQVSGASVRSVTTVTMAGYYDLSEFERAVIVNTREMGHTISEVVMRFEIFPYDCFLSTP